MIPTPKQQHPLRVAIIGYGNAGSVFHAPLIAATEGLQVAAIVTGNAERQRLARTHYPQANILASADELWSQAAHYDLAVVATANASHVPLGLAAMQAGLPVVIDKPIAASVQDAERLLETSNKTGVLLTVFQNRRWDNDFLTVRKLLANNALGPITRFESRFERYRAEARPGAWREDASPDAAGGLLYDIGSHLIDQALVLFGKPTHVYAEMAQRRPHAHVDDDTFVALHFANGIIAHLWMSLVARIPAQRVRISGLNGTYEKWGLDPQEAALRAGDRPGDANWGREPREHWGRLATINSQGEIIDEQIESETGAYERYYTLLRDALINGYPPPVDATSIIDVLRIIHAAQHSAQKNTITAL